MSLRQDVPLLNALAVFEAAARTSSFTAAARELHIAQSAVSRHVSKLEHYFGLRLFEREKQRLILTLQGRRLADAVTVGIGHIRAVITELRRETQAKAVTIACSYDFAYLWLMPRFGLLRERVGELELRLFASHNYAEFDAEHVDLSVRFGARTDWPDFVCVRLFGEGAFPICSPAFLKAHPQLMGADPALLRNVPLLRTEQRGLGWRDWFTRSGQPPAALKGHVFSNYMGVLYEVLAARGVALGYTNMLGDLVERGLLVRLSETTVETDQAYYVVHRGLPQSTASVLAHTLAEMVECALEPAAFIAPAMIASGRSATAR